VRGPTRERRDEELHRNICQIGVPQGNDQRLVLLFYDGPNGTVMGLVEPERPVDLGNITANGEYWVRKKR